MKVEMRPLTQIKPYEGNPRLNNGAVKAVAESIRQFGFRQPIVVDSEDVIVCGDTRYRAAQKLGLAEVPVHVATDLTAEQVRAYRIADNKTAELADWDLELLPIELGELAETGVDWSQLGFTRAELAKLIDPGVAAGVTDPDEVPAAPEAAITQPGDLWLLGDHRLLCGDSALDADVDFLLAVDPAKAAEIPAGSDVKPKLLPVHLVNTDPPYNVKASPRGKTEKGRPRDRRLTNDSVSDEAFDRMLHAWFGNMARVLVPGGSFYIWGGGYPTKAGGVSNGERCAAGLRSVGLSFSQLIVWDKQHPVLGRKDFMTAFEICFYGWKEGAGHNFYGPNNATDLWHVKKVNPQSMVHLTEKPVELAVRAIQYSSKPGENVLDLFGGSGSTLIAAQQTQRKAFLMEIDALYCDVIVQRWEKFTGGKAERIAAPVVTPAAVETSAEAQP